jgi:hypothetical protein
MSMSFLCLCDRKIQSWDKARGPETIIPRTDSSWRLLMAAPRGGSGRHGSGTHMNISSAREQQPYVELYTENIKVSGVRRQTWCCSARRSWSGARRAQHLGGQDGITTFRTTMHGVGDLDAMTKVGRNGRPTAAAAGSTRPSLPTGTKLDDAVSI